METILLFLNRRSFLIVGGVVASVVLAVQLRRSARLAEESRRLAAERGAAVAADILRDYDSRESLRLKALHRAVSAEIAAAAARGYDMRRLQGVADDALTLDAPGSRATAVERLNQLRLLIPRPRETFRAAGADEHPNEDSLAAPPSRAAR